MKIIIGSRDKAFCLHIPLTLFCNRVSAALLAGRLRRTVALPDGSGETTTAITTAQMHGLLKMLKQSKKLLQQRGLPLLDVGSNGDRFMITL